MRELSGDIDFKDIKAVESNLEILGVSAVEDVL
jgi:hypothetical protein